jgi:hypothetical protein
MFIAVKDKISHRVYRGGFRVCGALGWCSARGPRTENMMRCMYMLEALLYIRTLSFYIDDVNLLAGSRFYASWRPVDRRLRGANEGKVVPVLN